MVATILPPPPGIQLRAFRFSPALPRLPAFTLGDAIIRLGPASLLSFWAVHWYALLSTRRVAVAYILSLVFSLVYGYVAARNLTAERILMPLLDVLLSAPILSFLPVVLLSLSADLAQAVAVELAAIILTFTSQTWKMAFSVYQSLTMVPTTCAKPRPSSASTRGCASRRSSCPLRRRGSSGTA